jgi:hypothetical protein
MTFEQLKQKTYYLKMHKAYNNGNLEIMAQIKKECLELIDTINDAFETGFHVGENYDTLWNCRYELSQLIDGCNKFLCYAQEPKKLEYNEDGQLCFEHEGMEITDPFSSECMRFEVNPVEYYGLTHKQVEQFLPL